MAQEIWWACRWSNASHITPLALDKWEQRLENFFDGTPYDMLDAALSDTVSKYIVDIQVRKPTWLIQMVCYIVMGHNIHEDVIMGKHIGLYSKST